MLDLTPPDGWLEAVEWTTLGVVSVDSTYRLHIAEERADPALYEIVENLIIEELEANYGVEFETDGEGRFRRAP